MQTPDLNQLRRFALAMGLLLLTSIIAGVTLDGDLRVSPFGIPFRIARPDLVPLGLALAAVYGLARYYYYGIMLAVSPYRARRDVLDELHAEGARPNAKVGVYLGPTKFSSRVWTDERDKVERLAERLPAVFPKFVGARASARVSGSRHVDEDGDSYVTWGVEAVIPV
jgi:hypothetical protein